MAPDAGGIDEVGGEHGGYSDGQEHSLGGGFEARGHPSLQWAKSQLGGETLTQAFH